MKPYGFVFDTEGASIVCDEPTGMMLQGVINSSCFLEYMKLLAPTLHFGLSDVSKVPVPIIEDGEIQKAVMNLVRKLRFDSKTDYDSFETSWDFKRHPLL